MTNSTPNPAVIIEGRNNIAYRQTLLKKITYPHLPIVTKKHAIIDAIRKNQVVIITGETGSGKTTQIPKMCLEAGRGKYGLIGCTQPRRVAAIATACRIAEEMGETLGLSVGYKIRFDDKSGIRQGIKIMTDGILLMETQTDSNLNAYDTIIVDEAHERSLNIDFILGILKTLLGKRKNLKLIITSATIDSEKFSRFFGGAPVIEVSGRTYPVEVRYAPVDKDSDGNEDLSDPEAAVRAVEQLQAERLTGDILIFMATERDVRETCEILKGKFDRQTVILPLFARLPWSEQRRIFQPGKSPKIIVATNIAETSLTIPGIRYVIDPGTARISQYNPRLRTNSLPVEGISRSSADQRRGRCGRVAKGICLRLYSEEAYNNRPQFTPPEIMRSNLSGVILKMLTLQVGDIASFPFIDRPPQRSFQDGLDSLRELGAIEKSADDGSAVKLTEKGRLMARIPLDPRLARMLIEAKKQDCLEETAIIAAALSLPDPRERPADKERDADQMHALFKDPASDFMTLLKIWKGFQCLQDGSNSRNGIKRYCRDHFLSYKRMCEWQDIHGQIQHLLGKKISPGATSKDYQALYAAIHKSLLSGYLSNIATKKEKNFYQATRGREVMLFPGSGLFNKGGNWIVAAEIVETSRVFARICANIECDWLEELGGELCRSAYSEPHWAKNRGEVVAYEQVSLFGLVIVARRPVSYGPIAPEEAQSSFIREALVAGEVKNPLPFQLHNQKIMESITALEDKIRRTDLLVPEEVITRFYEQRLTGVYSIRTLQKLIRDRGSDNFLRLQESDLLANLPDADELSLYPDQLQLGRANFPLVYCFAPGNSQDGVTVKIPLHLISAIEPGNTDWLIPGLLREKINVLLKGLPKEYRKRLLPLNRACDYLIGEMKDRQGEGDFLSSLRKCIHQRYNIEIPLSAWPLAGLPEHLRMRFAIQDEKEREVAAGRDLSLLKAETVHQIQSRAFEDCRILWERSGIRIWDFGELPDYVELRDNHGLAGWAYPALSPADGSVQIRLFQDKEEAERCHREGVIVLFSLHCRDLLKYLKKSIVLSEESKFWTRNLGGPKVVETALYRRTLTNLFDISVRTEEAFYQHAALIKTQILAEGQEVLKVVLPILKSYHETTESLRSLTAANRANRSFEEFLGYLREALARIAPPDFMENYSCERLWQMPRYLRALTTGAQRGVLHLDKAMGKVREMQLLVEEGQNMIDSTSAFRSQEKLKAMDEYFWMIEEYRVSLFAQELKTAYPISRKKLAQKMKEIEMMNS